jgi:glycosyltransferase involved in cell wall biosynthesis
VDSHQGVYPEKQTARLAGTMSDVRMTMHTISVITVVKNAEKTILSCIDSVGQQTIPAEHLIIDGLSNDRTVSVISGLANRRLRVVSEPDTGIYDAMNKGIRQASGDIIGILNADDVYYDNRVLERVKTALSTNADQACYGDLVYVASQNLDDVRRYWQAGSFKREKMYWGWMPPHPTFFVRRSVYDRYGLFNLSLGSAADYELMLRFLFKHRITVSYIPRVLIKMRSGGVSNQSIRNRLKAHKMDHKAWKVNGLRPYPWTLLMKPIRKIPQFFRRSPHTR